MHGPPTSTLAAVEVQSPRNGGERSSLAGAGASGPGQVVLSSSSHNTALIGTVADSVGANASIGPWISRSYNLPLNCDDVTTDESIGWRPAKRGQRFEPTTVNGAHLPIPRARSAHDPAEVIALDSRTTG
jgi:hypothetical protein